MFATDIACIFDTPGKGQKAMLFVPDLRGKKTNYIVEHVGKDELLGSFVQLVVLDAQSHKTDESFYLAHTQTRWKQGDIVQTGDVLGQMTLDGATTGWHVHVEYRRLSKTGVWKSERYFTGAREAQLDNKRKGITYTGWKWGDVIYATNYDLGDVNQNDASPFIGASGKDLRHVPKAVALTKDVRASLGLKWGDRIVIESLRTGLEHEVQIEDEMNQRFRNSGPSTCVKPNSGSTACIKMDIPRHLPEGEYRLIAKSDTIGQP